MYTGPGLRGAVEKAVGDLTNLAAAMPPEFKDSALVIARNLRRALVPCVCHVGAQECALHPGRLRTKEEKVAFRKAWDAAVS